MSVFNGINGTAINPMASPITPAQQVVIPQITIPQGLSSVFQQPVTQLSVKGGAEAARKLQLPAGSRVAIFDDDADLFYYRELDQNGNEIAFDTFSYSKVEPPAPPRYLTVDEFRSELESFGKQLKEELGNGRSVRTENGKQYNPNKQQPSNGQAGPT